MSRLSRTPLDQWAAGRIGLSLGMPLTRQVLDSYQEEQLHRTIQWAATNSPIYQQSLRNLELPLPGAGTAALLACLPFTCGEYLCRDGMPLLCLPPGQVSRIVTLSTSGTTGPPKRLAFREEEQEEMRNFFHYGLMTFSRPGDSMLIMLPGERFDSVGSLLCQAAARYRVKGVLCPAGDNWRDVAGLIQREEVNIIFGPPQPILALARQAPGLPIREAVLTTDYVSRSLRRALEKIWGCRVLEHYGMTEMGYGGAMECAAMTGGHLREAELLYEVVDPTTGQPLPPGEEGEVVFTTLTRRAMPLLRYRTGDLGRLLTEPCLCGSVLWRLAPGIRRRMEGRAVGSWGSIAMADLDEVVFDLPSVLDYTAALTRKAAGDCLHIEVECLLPLPDVENLRQTLFSAPCLSRPAAGGLELTITVQPPQETALMKHWLCKRLIKEVLDLGSGTAKFKE